MWAWSDYSTLTKQDGINDSHIWAEKYGGTLDDVFHIQEKVSQSIANALKLTLSPDENKKITEHKVGNLQVYECYLRARQDIWKYTEDGLDRAERILKYGLNLLGVHELLYTGLGQVYFQFYDAGIRQEEEYLNKLGHCINKVFRHNPDSAYGYHLSGLLKLKKENAIKAYEDFKRAFELNPPDVETNSVKIYYETYGSGEPLLLLHGFMGSHKNWSSWIEDLSKEYQLIVPDLRGHGRSTNPSNVYTHELSARDMFGLLDKLEIDRFKAIGHSTSAMLSRYVCFVFSDLHLKCQRRTDFKKFR